MEGLSPRSTRPGQSAKFAEQRTGGSPVPNRPTPLSPPLDDTGLHSPDEKDNVFTGDYQVHVHKKVSTEDDSENTTFTPLLGSDLISLASTAGSEELGEMVSLDHMIQHLQGMMNKFQQNKAEYEKVVQENFHLKKEHAESDSRKDLEIKRLESWLQYLRAELRHRLKPENCPSETEPVKFDGDMTDRGNGDQRTSETNSDDRRTNLPLSEQNTVEFSEITKNLLNNSDRNDSDKSVSEEMNVCSCTHKLRKICKEKNRIYQDLQIEQRKNKSLNSRITALEAKLTLVDNGGASDFVPEDLSNFQENGDNRLIKDLKTDITVLKQQMVVAVEDFEKERSERERTVSSRNKLQEKFAKLNSKVSSLEYQLMLSRENVQEKVATVNRLQQHIRTLSAELRSKDNKISELSEHLMFTRLPPPVSRPPPPRVSRPPPPDVAKQLLQNFSTAKNMATANHADTNFQWSCDECTFLNSAARTVCELCGNIRKFGDMATAHVAGHSHVHHGNLYRRSSSGDAGRCRLVSRGLSTDNGGN